MFICKVVKPTKEFCVQWITSVLEDGSGRRWACGCGDGGLGGRFDESRNPYEREAVGSKPCFPDEDYRAAADDHHSL